MHSGILFSSKFWCVSVCLSVCLFILRTSICVQRFINAAWLLHWLVWESLRPPCRHYLAIWSAFPCHCPEDSCAYLFQHVVSLGRWFLKQSHDSSEYTYINTESLQRMDLKVILFISVSQSLFTYGPVVCREEPTQPYTYLQLDPGRSESGFWSKTSSESWTSMPSLSRANFSSPLMKQFFFPRPRHVSTKLSMFGCLYLI